MKTTLKTMLGTVALAGTLAGTLAGGTAYAQNDLTGAVARRDNPVGEGREYRVKFANAAGNRLVLGMDADVNIEGYDGDEVIIRASDYEAPPERAKGLRPLYAGGTDNSGIGLSVTTEGKVLTITKVTRQGGDYTLRVPRRVSVDYEQLNWQGGDVTINNLDGDIEVKTLSSDVKLTRVTGPVVASSTSGDITVVFAALSQARPSSLSNISGDIDVSVPVGTKMRLRMKSITGEIYSDLDLPAKPTKRGLTRVGGETVEMADNEGTGVEVNLSTISSDIYVRKAK